MSVCVVHLVWAPLGLGPFQRFVASYRREPAGAAHRLLIVYNGFAPGETREAYYRELDCVAHAELVLPRPVQDIAAYFEAAAAVPEPQVCFLNSYSVVLASDWLKKLCDALERPGMGAVGATGSAQSHPTLLWELGWPLPPRRGWRQAVRAALSRLGVPRLWRRFALFPNDHLRTNAFLIDRALFLGLRQPCPDKPAAERFESGRRGLTARLRARGLAVGVVGRDGVCHLPGQWARSRTFRSGAQENLLVADNRTAEYAAADPARQRQMAAWAWGTQAPP